MTEHDQTPTSSPSASAVAAATQRAEVAGPTVTVTWRDLTPFEVPLHYADLPYEVIFAEEQGNQAGVIAALLPPAVLAEFRASRPRMADAQDLLRQMANARGFGSTGESPASTV